MSPAGKKVYGPPRPTPRGGVTRFLLRHFVRGLLLVVPAATTIWILVTAFLWLGGMIRLPVEWRVTIPWTDLEVPLARQAVGFLTMIAGVVLIGILTSNVLTRWIVRRLEVLFQRVPIVKLIYAAVKDMVQAFVSEEKKFDKPVLLSFTEDPEVEVIGFVTRSDLSEFARPDKVAVYVPQSYNFAANLILVPRERVTPIELPASDVMAFVVSGGVSLATRPANEEADPS